MVMITVVVAMMVVPTKGLVDRAFSPRANLQVMFLMIWWQQAWVTLDQNGYFSGRTVAVGPLEPYERKEVTFEPHKLRHASPADAPCHLVSELTAWGAGHRGHHRGPTLWPFRRIIL
jgi:hypothetical protein